MHIVVVGGGPAGAVAALTSAGRGHDVTVVEARTDPAQKIGECLTPGSGPMLDMLGLLDGMQRSGHLPSPGNLSFWGSAAPHERDFLFGRQGHGWHLDRQRFEADLEGVAVASGVLWYRGHRLRLAVPDGETWDLVVDVPSGTLEMTADALIDATGRTRSLARKLSTVQPATLPGGGPDRLIGSAAVYAAGPTSGLRDRRAVVESTEQGWWYSALIAGGDLVVVSMTDADLLGQPESLDTMLSLAERTSRRISCHGGSLRSPRRTQLASGSRLDQAYGPGWIAVGDAALAFDPLSSYGITSAMGTAYYAAHALADGLAGDPNAQPIYQAVLDQTWQRYLIEHEEHYSIESRWSDHPFWARRRAPGS